MNQEEHEERLTIPFFESYKAESAGENPGGDKGQADVEEHRRIIVFPEHGDRHHIPPRVNDVRSSTHVEQCESSFRREENRNRIEPGIAEVQSLFDVTQIVQKVPAPVIKPGEVSERDEQLDGSDQRGQRQTKGSPGEQRGNQSHGYRRNQKFASDSLSHRFV